MTQRVAIVTGANRGIGLEICRQLAAQGLRVVLTSRDGAKGQAACRDLAASGTEVAYHSLDVTDPDSVRALAAYLEKTWGRADILVNNAGIMADPKGAKLFALPLPVLEQTLDTNLYGPLRLCQAVVPLMRRHRYGRIVNLSSGLGQLAEMGEGTPAYRVSKTALNALTRILAAECSGHGILVNSMCPGWVRTGMGGPDAPRTPAQAADTAVWLATLPDQGPTGGFFRDREAIAW